MKLTKEQQKAINYMKTGKNIFVTGIAGSGKCLAPGTEVLMYDGSIVNVEDIKTGDFIMGDDSKPRTVLSTTKGQDEMFCVNSEYDVSYNVNSEHILSLKINPVIFWINECKYYKFIYGKSNGVVYTKYFNDFKDLLEYNRKLVKIVDIPVSICYKNQDIPFWRTVFTSYNAVVSFPNKPTLFTPYSFAKFLLKFDIYKKIPIEYKLNSIRKRLEFIAGLVDYSGNYEQNICTINYVKNSYLEDILFICRSVGLRCIYDKKNKKITLLGNLPKLPTKKYFFFSTKKNYPIFIHKRPKSDYYGFEIDGNHRFVLGSFTVTHNTHCIKYFYDTYKLDKNIAMTSTTGISALLIKGTTLHSYLGIGLGRLSVDKLYTKIKKAQYSFQRWKNLDILVIDEISMLSPDLFDKLNYLGKRLRNSQKPFGGIQLILSGDFLQLPAVNSKTFCFEAKTWDETIDETVYLQQTLRQDDTKFTACLNKIRMGIVDDSVKSILNSRVDSKIGDTIRPTKIYSLNKEVDIYNESELDILAEDGREFKVYNLNYELLEKVKRHVLERALKNVTAPLVLEICNDCQVMLLKNIEPENGLVNGSRGVVIGFENDKPIVRFLNGIERIIDFETWDVYDGDRKIIVLKQLPLKVAYAVTIHKCVSENTIIPTSDGMKRISKIFKDSYPNQRLIGNYKISTLVYGLGSNPQKASKIFQGTVEKSLIFETLFGYTIETSMRHRLLCVKKSGEMGWKKAPFIKTGNKVCLRSSTYSLGRDVYKLKAECHTILIDRKMSYIIGTIMSDTYVPSKKKPILKTIKRILYKSERIPFFILENTYECQREYLKGLFNNLAIVKKEGVYLKLKSETFAVDIQCFLLNLGVIALRKKERIFITGNHIVNLGKLDIFQYVENEIFHTITSDYILTNEKAELIQTITEAGIFTDKKILERYLRVQKNQRDVFYDKIFSIKEMKCKMYDLYVENTHSFVGNGIINHNSQGATIDLASVNLSSVFDYGQFYVSLSRVRKLEGLTIDGKIDWSRLKAHPKAIKYYKTKM